MLPSEVPRLTTDLLVRVFPGVWKLLSFLRLPSQGGSPSLPLLSLFLSFIFFSLPLCVCLQCRKLGFDPWVGKISWRRKWHPTPVFLPGEFHGRRNLVVHGVTKSRTPLSNCSVSERLHRDGSVLGWTERSHNCGSKFFSILYFSSVTTESFLRDLRTRFCLKDSFYTWIDE